MSEMISKLSLYLSGSFSTKIEELAPVDTVDADGRQKSEVEILIERINVIRRDLPEPEKIEMSPEEQAFTEAADEQLEALSELRRRRFRNRR